MSDNQNHSAGSARTSERGGVRAVGAGRIGGREDIRDELARDEANDDAGLAFVEEMRKMTGG